MDKGNHDRKLLLAGLQILTVGLFCGVTAAVIIGWGDQGLPIVPVLALLLGVLVVIIWAALRWWRRLDHMQKDAQYSGWYWGGSIGLAASFLFVIAWFGIGSEVAAGALIVVLAQLFGFVVHGIYWKFRYRGADV